MRRWELGLVCAVLILCARVPAYGHAVVTKASLDDAPVHAGVPTQVRLRFNSRIEPGFAQVTLLASGTKDRPLEVSEKVDEGVLAVTLPALAPGPYALRYKVLAADGHITENVLRFNVTPAE